jgi:hypothetical protein
MNQFGLQYVYTWICQNETLYADVLNKQKYVFFQKWRQEGKTGEKKMETGKSCLGVGISPGGRI